MPQRSLLSHFVRSQAAFRDDTDPAILTCPLSWIFSPARRPDTLRTRETVEINESLYVIEADPATELGVIEKDNAVKVSAIECGLLGSEVSSFKHGTILEPCIIEMSVACLEARSTKKYLPEIGVGEIDATNEGRLIKIRKVEPTTDPADLVHQCRPTEIKLGSFPKPRNAQVLLAARRVVVDRGDVMTE